MLPIANRVDFERLIKDGVKESLTLDYKRSDALAKEEKRKTSSAKMLPHLQIPQAVN